jgi:Holliday junction DNA helicase RuvA
MIYSISGKLIAKKEGFIAVEASGVSFKIFIPAMVMQNLPSIGGEIKIFCYLYLRQDGLELYGFLGEQELNLFEKLNSVSGVGPKSALGILSVAKSDQLIAAINEGKVDLLTRASGIGKKTAERIVLELKGKLNIEAPEKLLTLMESDVELEETLISLGYTKQEAKSAISKINPKITGFKERLKEALKGARR